MYPQQSYKVGNTTPSTRNDSFNATFDLPVVMVASSSSDRNAMTQNDDNVVRDEQLVSKDGNGNGNNTLTNYSLALIITIGIGCVLLMFNVLVFVLVYRKKSTSERSTSDKNSGSIRSVSSNNSVMLGMEAGGQVSKRLTENGGPSLNLKNNTGTLKIICVRKYRIRTLNLNTRI